MTNISAQQAGSKKGKFFLLLHFCFIQALNRLDYFANKGPSSQSYGFSSSQMWIWELDCKESWVPKNLCFWTVVLERLLSVPWTARKSNQSILKEISPEYSLEGLMLKLKLQYFGHLMWRADSLEKDPDARKDWRQEEKGTTEDEMVGWHHWSNGHEFEQTLGDGEGQGSLVCWGPWGRRVGHNWATEQQCIRKNANMIRNHIQTQTHMKTGFKKPKLGDWDSQLSTVRPQIEELNSHCAHPLPETFLAPLSLPTKPSSLPFQRQRKPVFTPSKPQRAGI